MRTSSVYVWWELLAPPVVIAVLVVVGLKRLRRSSPSISLAMLRMSTVGWVSVAQFFGYIAAFSISFGFGDTGTAVPWPLAAAVFILGLPLTYLIYLKPVLAGGGRWLGDGICLLSSLAALNAVLWGIAVAWLTGRLRKRLPPKGKPIA